MALDTDPQVYLYTAAILLFGIVKKIKSIFIKIIIIIITTFNW
jgi:hypothetical protein